MKRAVDEVEDDIPATAGTGVNSADGKKRRVRRGRRKSKAERLARVAAPSAAAGAAPSVSLEGLKQLLDDPASTTSNEWDRAQNVALQLNSRAARKLLVTALLGQKRAPKAAAHYAKRLHMSEDEIVEVLTTSGSRDGDGGETQGGDHSATGRHLAIAKFLVEVGEELVATHTRLDRFLWPWLELSTQRIPPGANPSDPELIAKKRRRTELKAAVRLLLYPVPEGEPCKSGKRERSEALHRLLVQACLDHGRFLYLVPGYAKSGYRMMALPQHVATEPPVDARGDEPHDQQEQLRVRHTIVAKIEAVLRMIWPDCSVTVFGSSTTGLLLPPQSLAADQELDSPSSPESKARQDDAEQREDDLDLCVIIPSNPVFRKDTAPLIVELKEHLALYMPDLRDPIAIEGARVPIVQATDATTGIKCEICVNNVAALWNTYLMRWYLSQPILTDGDKAVRLNVEIHRFCMWLKRWRRVKKRVVGVSLSSYGLLLLAVYFLQQEGVLPAIDCSELATKSEEALDSFSVDAVAAHFQNQHDPRPALATDSSVVTRVLTEGWWGLVERFFVFYATQFDYENVVVSIRSTTVTTKTNKRWERKVWKSAISIEDPIEVNRDLGMLFTRKTLGKLRCAFAHACVVFSSGELASSPIDQEAALLASHPYETQDHVTPAEDDADDAAMSE